MTSPSAQAPSGEAADGGAATGSTAAAPQVRGAAGAGPTTAPGSGFAALFHAEFPVMFRLAHLLGAADPEDIAAEAFARLHARWATLADTDRAGGYLRATVVNLCRSAGRRRVVAARHDAAVPDPKPVASAETLALQAVSDAALLAALEGLAPRHREALVLRFWLDLSESQMAEAMGCSAGSVKSHVSRGLKALRAALGVDSNRKGEIR